MVLITLLDDVVGYLGGKDNSIGWLGLCLFMVLINYYCSALKLNCGRWYRNIFIN